MKRYLLLVVTSLVFFFSEVDVFGCTNFLVGKDASVDGSTLLTYAADSYTLYGYLHFKPAADHKNGEMRDIFDWDTGKKLGSIPEVQHTYRVVGNMNEHQLTIGETTWGGRAELADTSGQGIDYGSLMYIALERCKTAREAIQCMTDLVEKYGYASEGETFSLADPNEVWILEMVGKGSEKGAVWVATRIPDDCICAHANQARTTHINFEDKENCLYSKDVVTFAQKRGYFSGNKSDFSFEDAYAPVDFSALYVCEARVWSFFNHFVNNMQPYYDYAFGNTFVKTKGKEIGNRMPLFFKPDRKVSVQDLRICMRDHYDNTPNDITKTGGCGQWNSKLRYGTLGFSVDSVKYWYPRPTATQQTGWSFVAQMNTRFSARSGGVFWFGVDDAATSVYIPFFSSTQFIPNALQKGNGDLYSFSSTSAWWIFNIVANWAYTKYSKMKPEIEKVQRRWETYFDDQIATLRQKADLCPTDSAAHYMLSEFSNQQTNHLLSDWKDLGVYLFVKYLDGQEKKERNGVFLRDNIGEPLYPDRPSLPESELRKIINATVHE